ncbi:MAG TPA: GyrI-like domain-containing protein [Acidimicrobiia bacterium]|nr:GyrI-like domain-containing protein [Acidimicrobiia bacterium]
METIDFKKKHRALYTAPKDTPVIVEVPPLQYVMVDGSGNPNTSPRFQECMSGLYPMAYTLRFAIKAEEQVAYSVMPLQGLWWLPGDEFDFSVKDRWIWTLMIMQPDYVTADRFEAARKSVKKKDPLTVFDELRLEVYDEGLSAQIMHIGPYADEAPTIEKLHAFIRNNGHARRGKHHEIYVGDPNRSAPEKLKTIIRQPIE